VNHGCEAIFALNPGGGGWGRLGLGRQRGRVGRRQQLGRPGLGRFAQKAGVGAQEAPSVLASILPELVNQLTPKGQVLQGMQAKKELVEANLGHVVSIGRKHPGGQRVRHDIGRLDRRRPHAPSVADARPGPTTLQTLAHDELVGKLKSLSETA
jgi:hypothetical protein